MFYDIIKPYVNYGYIYVLSEAISLLPIKGASLCAAFIKRSNSYVYTEKNRRIRKCILWTK